MGHSSWEIILEREIQSVGKHRGKFQVGKHRGKFHVTPTTAFFEIEN